MLINCLPLNGKLAVCVPLGGSKPSTLVANSYPEPPSTEQGLGKVVSAGLVT